MVRKARFVALTVLILGAPAAVRRSAESMDLSIQRDHDLNASLVDSCGTLEQPARPVPSSVASNARAVLER